MLLLYHKEDYRADKAFMKLAAGESAPPCDSIAGGAPSSDFVQSEATREYRPGKLGETDKLYAARHIVEQLGSPGLAYMIEVQPACEY